MWIYQSKKCVLWLNTGIKSATLPDASACVCAPVQSSAASPVSLWCGPLAGTAACSACRPWRPGRSPAPCHAACTPPPPGAAVDQTREKWRLRPCDGSRADETARPNVHRCTPVFGSSGVGGLWALLWLWSVSRRPTSPAGSPAQQCDEWFAPEAWRKRQKLFWLWTDIIHKQIEKLCFDVKLNWYTSVWVERWHNDANYEEGRVEKCLYMLLLKTLIKLNLMSFN